MIAQRLADLREVLQFLRPVGSKQQAERTRTLRAVQQFVDDVGLPLAAHHLDGNAEAATDVYGYLLVVHIDGKVSASRTQKVCFMLRRSLTSHELASAKVQKISQIIATSP